MTASLCRSHCSLLAFQYYALSLSTACYCTDTLPPASTSLIPHTSSAYPDLCSRVPCAGDPTQLCGAQDTSVVITNTTGFAWTLQLRRQVAAGSRNSTLHGIGASTPAASDSHTAQSMSSPNMSPVASGALGATVALSATALLALIALVYRRRSTLRQNAQEDEEDAQDMVRASHYYANTANNASLSRNTSAGTLSSLHSHPPRSFIRAPSIAITAPSYSAKSNSDMISPTLGYLDPPRHTWRASWVDPRPMPSLQALPSPHLPTHEEEHQKDPFDDEFWELGVNESVISLEQRWTSTSSTSLKDELDYTPRLNVKNA